MSRRSPALLLAGLMLGLTAAATTIAALTAWRGFLTTPTDYLLPLTLLGMALATTGGIARWTGLPRLATASLQALIAVIGTTLAITGSLLPVGAAGAGFADSLSAAMDSARTYSAPISRGVPSIAPLLVVGGACILWLVDTLAITMRRVPLAGLALLAVYAVPAGLTDRSASWVSFVGAAAGFMALLHLDAREGMMRWGRTVGPDQHSPWTESNPLGDAVRAGAGRIGIAATVLALAVPVVVPVADLDLFGIGPGGGGDDITIRKPRADLRRDLERGENIPLVRIETKDPDPEYLRIGVLNRFTGSEWSSGDRDVAADQTAEGDLPDPPGLSDQVPRTAYDYDVTITEAFDSTWLPTQFPISRIEAGDDWRYDRSTMDFLAVGNETTELITYSMTELDLDYGTDGRYFRNASAGAVPSEVLEVPGGIPSSVRDYAQQVTKGAKDDYERARMLQDWFRRTGNFKYSVRKAPEGGIGDTLETFLSPKDGGRVGYCEQFAAAMAIMARTVGIPARLAVGFLRPTLIGPGVWEYRSHDLHAWPELYFEGAGWVRFEPTPSRRTAEAPDYSTVPVRTAPDGATDSASPDASNSARPTVRPSQSRPTSNAPNPDTETDASKRSEGDAGWLIPVLLLLSLGALATLGLLPGLLRRRQQRTRLAGDAEQIWSELRATALDLSIVWPDGRSPREIGDGLAERLASPEQAQSERPRTGLLQAPAAGAALTRIVSAVEFGRYALRGTVQATPGAATDAPESESLAADALMVIAALENGATAAVRRRGTWWPRSLFRRG